MWSESEIANAREDYLAGRQPRNADGDRLWTITAYNYWPPTPGLNFKMWVCQTAEGPEITAMRDDRGKCYVQVDDGSRERVDACAARFVLNCEWNNFLNSWDFVHKLSEE